VQPNTANEICNSLLFKRLGKERGRGGWAPEGADTWQVSYGVTEVGWPGSSGDLRLPLTEEGRVQKRPEPRRAAVRSRMRKEGPAVSPRRGLRKQEPFGGYYVLKV